jgi:putative acetyltransferase
MSATGIKLLRVETGIHQREAIGLYERAGFESISPFSDYKPDPLGRFYEKRIVCEVDVDNSGSNE